MWPGGPLTDSSNCVRRSQSFASGPCSHNRYTAFLYVLHVCQALSSVNRCTPMRDSGAFGMPAADRPDSTNPSHEVAKPAIWWANPERRTCELELRTPHREPRTRTPNGEPRTPNPEPNLNTNRAQRTKKGERPPIIKL